MVLAVFLVLSESLCAARPVGEAKTILDFFAERISTTARSIVVFPVPGPPVMRVILWDSAVCTASCCLDSNSTLAFSCAHFRAESNCIFGKLERA